MQLNTYLTFDGDCEAAFRFYAETFSGKITTMMTFKEGPFADQVPADTQDKIMHAELEIDGYVLMGTDGASCNASTSIQGASVTISVDDPGEAERIFNALSEDGEVTMAMEETFWAQRFGAVTDRFGVPWMVNCNKEN